MLYRLLVSIALVILVVCNGSALPLRGRSVHNIPSLDPISPTPSPTGVNQRYTQDAPRNTPGLERDLLDHLGIASDAYTPTSFRFAQLQAREARAACSEPVKWCERDVPKVKLPNPLPPKLQQAIDSIPDIIAKYTNPSVTPGPEGYGVSLIVTYDQQVLYAGNGGRVNRSATPPVAPTSDTIYRIGSVTKLFTDLLLLILRDAGKVQLDQDISTLSPTFAIRNPFAKTTRGLTLRQLGSHMAGLSREAPCFPWSDTDCHITTQEIYKRLANEYLILPPNNHPSYSNLGFALLGRVLGDSQNSTWEALVQEYILTPLNMTSTYFTVPSEATDRVAVGYNMAGQAQKLWDMGWSAPAGQMYSTANDMAKFMSFLFRDDSPYQASSEQILDGQTIREWMKPSYVNNDKFTAWGMPWEMFLNNFGWWQYCKSGAVPGYNAEMVTVPEVKLGVWATAAYLGAEPGGLLAYYTAGAVLNPLLEALISLEPALPAITSQAALYTGIYTQSHPSLGQVTANISLLTSGDDHYLYLNLTSTSGSGVAAILMPAGSPYNVQTASNGGAPLPPAAFQLYVGAAPSCTQQDNGILRNYVFFSPADTTSQKTSFSLPGFLASVIPTRSGQ